MAPGTAKLLHTDVPLNLYVVRYRGGLMVFHTEQAALDWCQSQRLKIINDH